LASAAPFRRLDLQAFNFFPLRRDSKREGFETSSIVFAQNTFII